jgi:hypothetical protein
MVNPVVHSFVPTSHMPSSVIGVSRRSNVKQSVLGDYNDGNDQKEPLTSTVFDVAEDDAATKEIIIESFSRMRPEDFLVETTTAATNLVSFLAISNTTRGDTIGTTTSISTMNEDVKAILAASEEAVAAAEATMSPDLAKQLDLVTMNGTTTTTRMPPESLVVEPSLLPEILPASKVVGEPATKTIDAPGVAKILKFAIPAIGVWLCGPLLSLIDTSAVGVFSGTVQQAALNPAVAVTDYAALLIVRIQYPENSFSFMVKDRLLTTTSFLKILVFLNRPSCTRVLPTWLLLHKHRTVELSTNLEQPRL